MRYSATQHPEYPFRSELTPVLRERALQFVDSPAAGSPGAEFLHEFLSLVHAFAFLERLVQGDVLCELPAHLDRTLAGFVDPEDEGERLASAETGLLDWRPESADSLIEALDEIGVKIFCLEDPDSDLILPGPRSGAFAFEGNAGPAIFLGAPAHSPEAAFIAAHEFGHLVADINPYHPRFCQWDAETFAPLSDRPEELRADRFARALLMPREAFGDALRELGAPAAAATDPRAEQLAALFGVPAATVIRRMADLQLPAFGPQPARDAAEDVSSPAPEAAVQLTLPERYVNLALAAYAGRVLEIEELSRFLRIPVDEALRMTELFGVTPPSPEDADTLEDTPQ